MELTLKDKLSCALLGAGHLAIATSILISYKSFYPDIDMIRDVLVGGATGVLVMSSLIGILKDI